MKNFIKEFGEKIQLFFLMIAVMILLLGENIKKGIYFLIGKNED